MKRMMTTTRITTTHRPAASLAGLGVFCAILLGSPAVSAAMPSSVLSTSASRLRPYGEGSQSMAESQLKKRKRSLALRMWRFSGW